MCWFGVRLTEDRSDDGPDPRIGPDSGSGVLGGGGGPSGIPGGGPAPELVVTTEPILPGLTTAPGVLIEVYMRINCKSLWWPCLGRLNRLPIV